MKELLKPSQRHLLYKDECGDELVLLKGGEIVRNSATTIKLFLFSRALRNKVASRCKIEAETRTDDPLYVLTLKNAELGPILALQQGSKRTPKNGLRLKNAEKKLAHKLFPFNPSILRSKNNEN